MKERFKKFFQNSKKITFTIFIGLVLLFCAILFKNNLFGDNLAGKCFGENAYATEGCETTTINACSGAYASATLGWQPFTVESTYLSDVYNYYVCVWSSVPDQLIGCSTTLGNTTTSYTWPSLIGGKQYYWKAFVSYRIYYIQGNGGVITIEQGTQETAANPFTVPNCECSSEWSCLPYHPYIYTLGYQYSGNCSQNGEIKYCARPWPPCATGSACGYYDGWGDPRIPVGYECGATGQQCQACAYYDYESGNCGGYTTMNCYYLCPAPPNSPVLLNPPYVAPDWCSNEPQQYLFQWTFSDPNAGDTQSAKQLQIATNSSFANIVYDSGKIINSSPSILSPALPTGGFTFGQTYYWRVRVWDSTDRVSSWRTGPAAFTTPSSYYPTADFTFSPDKVIIGESINFTDASSGVGITRSWTFPGGTPSTSTDQNPVVTYDSRGTKIATITVTDSGGHVCSKSANVLVNTARYEWREIAPW